MTDKEKYYRDFLISLKFSIDYRLKVGDTCIPKADMREISEQIGRVLNDR